MMRPRLLARRRISSSSSSQLPKSDGEVETSICRTREPMDAASAGAPLRDTTEGVGGRPKAKPEHFRVTELLSSAPDGKKDRGDAATESSE